MNDYLLQLSEASRIYTKKTKFSTSKQKFYYSTTRKKAILFKEFENLCRFCKSCSLVEQSTSDFQRKAQRFHFRTREKVSEKNSRFSKKYFWVGHSFGRNLLQVESTKVSFQKMLGKWFFIYFPFFPFHSTFVFHCCNHSHSLTREWNG